MSFLYKGRQSIEHIVLNCFKDTISHAQDLVLTWHNTAAAVSLISRLYHLITASLALTIEEVSKTQKKSWITLLNSVE